MKKPVDVDFLRKVQANGWVVKAVDGDMVIAGCPRNGCGLSVKMRPERDVPNSKGANTVFGRVEIDNWEDVRLALRGRREELCLDIPEVEEAAGLSASHLSKIEKDNPVRTPTFETTLLILAALGMRVVLEYGDLPPKTLRTIEQTRDKVHRRRKFNGHHQRHRMRRAADQQAQE